MEAKLMGPQGRNHTKSGFHVSCFLCKGRLLAACLQQREERDGDAVVGGLVDS